MKIIEIKHDLFYRQKSYIMKVGTVFLVVEQRIPIKNTKYTILHKQLTYHSESSNNILVS